MDLLSHRNDRSLSWEFEGLVIRPCRLSDRQGIAELAVEVFGADRKVPAEQWRAEWDWKFNGAHLGETAASVAVDRNGSVVGHYGSLIRRFQLGAKLFETGVPVDNMVQERYRGGRLQMRLYENQGKWAKMGEVAWGIGAPNPTAYKIGKRLLGYENLAWMKALRANLSSRRHRIGFRLRERKAGWVHPRGAQVKEVRGFDERFEDLWERCRDQYVCVEERGLDWLRWRFDDAPGRSYTILALEEGERVQRYALIRTPEPGDGTWHVVDLFGTTDPDDLRAMARGITRWALGRVGWLEIHLAASEPHYAALLDAGFYWEGREQPLVYWVFDEKQVRRRVLAEPTNWYVTEAFHDTL
ncbi:MAG: hypothetical protein CME06_08125 [Gemmatimonadetes bacterium]|nr:hypothetical protein [Gemmatimonadota bacterium]